MYRVFAENNGVSVCIFDDRLLDQRVKLVDPVLELEDNTSGSLSFTVYPQNQGYAGDTIQTMASTIRVFRYSDEIWEGRPLSDDKDFYNGRLISCEGAYAYLNDVDQPYKEYLGADGAKLEIIDFIKGVLGEYNSKASLSRRFDIDGTYVNAIYIPKTMTDKGSVQYKADLPSSGNNINDVYLVTDTNTYYAWNYMPGVTETVIGWVDVTDNIHRNLGYTRKTGGESTKETIDALLEVFSGSHVKVVTVNGKRCLYFTVAEISEDEFVYAGSTPRPTKQKVSFGKNLLDIVKKRNGSEFFTVLLPVGAEISTSQPETIETMCTNVFQDAVERRPDHNLLQIRDAGEDVYNHPCVAPFDTTAVVSDYITGGPRRGVWVDMHSGNGYDYYLFTAASYCTDAIDNLPAQGDANVLFYHLVDVSPEYSTIRNMGAIGYMDPDATYGVTYRNARSVSQKKLSKSQGRQTIIEKFSIPETGSYNIGFAVDSDLMYAIQNGNPTSGETVPYSIPSDYFGTGDQQHSLAYPKLYKAPYKNSTYQYTGVRKVSDSDMSWVGTLADSHNIGGNPADSPYAQYGGDDHDIFYNQGGGGYIELTNRAYSGHYLDRYGPFARENYGDGEPLPSAWKGMYTGPVWGGHPGWSFLTGYFGHHVCKVMVEPGKTYYLNTRITNKPYPNVPDICPRDPETGYFVEYFNSDGSPKSLKQNQIFAYVVIARRRLRRTAGEAENWVNQLVSFKLTGTGVVTNELSMEKIQIPDSTGPEKKISWDDPNHDNIEHYELWFTCDNCYVNGCGNLTDTPRQYDGPGPDISNYPTGYTTSNPINGYRPSVYVEDATDTSGESTEGTDYRKCVTVAPLNKQQPAGYESFPREYMINKDLADKYGVIIKRVEYSEATSPQKLMQYANLLWAANTTDPAFEVTAVDLRDCGVEDVDNLRLHETIEIDTKPHGINGDEATLSQMSLNLNDLSSNTYTLGYDPNKGISSQVS